MFSANETVDDINSEDLRFLLVEYYLAGLRQRSGDMSSRLKQLSDAKRGLEAFIRDCVRREIVPKSEIAAGGFDSFVSDWPASGSVDSDDGDASGLSSSAAGISRASAVWAAAGTKVGAARSATRTIDPAAQRAQKIERFKRNQASKKRLKELALLHARLQRLEGGSSADGVGSTASLSGIDEDSRREMALLALQTAARSAIDEIASIDQELPILRHMAERQAQSSSSSSSVSASSAGRGHGARAQDDSRMSTSAQARAAAAAARDAMSPSEYAAAGPPPGDPSIDPTRKGLVRNKGK